MTAGSSERIAAVGRNWEALAKRDPLWAVLTHPRKRGGRWRTDEFFADGRQALAAELAHAESLRPGFPRAIALDFGCGPGRLARALAREFDRVIGVDISPEMIRLAREFNGDIPSVEFRLNRGPALDSIADGSVDFAISLITLQHIGGPEALGYIAELARVISPDGLAIFGVPERRDRLGSLRIGLLSLPARLLRSRSGPQMEMHGFDPAAVKLAVEGAGGRVLSKTRRHDAGPAWVAHTWAIARR